MAGFAAALCAFALPHIAVAAAPPHIVFILADDYGFNDISYHARKNGNDTNSGCAACLAAAHAACPPRATRR